MANALTTNPIVLDTAGATSAITSKLTIRLIVWSGIANDYDDLEIHTASSGNIIFDGTGLKGQNLVIDFGKNGFETPGLYLTTKDSGTVHIFV